MFSNNSWASFKKHLIIIYIAFMIVLLISTTVINFSSLSTGMNKEIANSQTLILNQISNTISSTLTSIERALYISSTDKSIQTFFEEKPESSSTQVLSDYAIQNNLAQLSKIHNINSIYLYNKATGNIISNKNSGTLRTFPDTDWIEYCNAAQTAYSWFGPRNIAVYNETVISLIRTYPINSSWEESKGFIILNITNNVLTDPLQNIDHSSTNEFFVLDADNKIIFQNNASSALSQETFTTLDFSQENNVFTEKIDNVKHSFFYTTNDKTHWKLVSVCRYKNLSKSVTTIKYYFIIVFLGTLIILILGILILSQKMYSPIDSLVNSVTSQLTKFTAPVSLKEIENIFHYTYQRNQRLNKQIQESLPGIKWKLINSILSNTYKDFASLQTELEAINYSFYSGGFAVALMDIDKINTLNTPPDELDLYTTALADKAEEQFNCIGLAIATKQLTGRVIVIASFKTGTASAQDCINAIQTVQGFMHNCFNVTVTAALSDLITDGARAYIQIPDAFHQATELLNYKAIIGYNSILTSDTIKASDKQSIQVFNALMDDLEYALKNVPQQCTDIIDRLFDEIAAQALPHELITHIVLQVLLLGIDCLGVSNIQDRAFDNEQYKNILYSLSQYETVSELQQVVTTIYGDLLFQQVSSGAPLAKSNNTLIENIIQYIKTDYGNYDMSIQLLSEKFAISQSYLSKLLKEHLNKSFTDLLIETRLENAEILLRQTDLKISEISERVGYNNTSSFIRAFKRVYYLKPSEYRTQHILNKSKPDTDEGQL